jgi:Tfp pilus assembly protein PilP
MKYALLLSALILAGCNESEAGFRMLSYQELVDYPTQCAKADIQLAQLKRIQQIKNFDSDQDNLNEDDRAYNSRLKATIWWYTYRCGAV